MEHSPDYAVTHYEACVLVLGFLEQAGFTKTAGHFKREARSQFRAAGGTAPPPGVRNLLDLLNDYVRLKDEEARRAALAARNPLASRVLAALDCEAASAAEEVPGGAPPPRHAAETAPWYHPGRLARQEEVRWVPQPQDARQQQLYAERGGGAGAGRGRAAYASQPQEEAGEGWGGEAMDFDPYSGPSGTALHPQYVPAGAPAEAIGAAGQQQGQAHVQRQQQATTPGRHRKGAPPKRRRTGDAQAGAAAAAAAAAAGGGAFPAAALFGGDGAGEGGGWGGSPLDLLSLPLDATGLEMLLDDGPMQLAFAEHLAQHINTTVQTVHPSCAGGIGAQPAAQPDAGAAAALAPGGGSTAGGAAGDGSGGGGGGGGYLAELMADPQIVLADLPADPYLAEVLQQVVRPGATSPSPAARPRAPSRSATAGTDLSAHHHQQQQHGAAGAAGAKLPSRGAGSSGRRQQAPRRQQQQQQAAREPMLPVLPIVSVEPPLLTPQEKQQQEQSSPPQPEAQQDDGQPALAGMQQPSVLPAREEVPPPATGQHPASLQGQQGQHALPPSPQQQQQQHHSPQQQQAEQLAASEGELGAATVPADLLPSADQQPPVQPLPSADRPQPLMWPESMLAPNSKEQQQAVEVAGRQEQQAPGSDISCRGEQQEEQQQQEEEQQQQQPQQQQHQPVQQRKQPEALPVQLGAPLPAARPTGSQQQALLDGGPCRAGSLRTAGSPLKAAAPPAIMRPQQQGSGISAAAAAPLSSRAAEAAVAISTALNAKLASLGPFEQPANEDQLLQDIDDLF